MKVVIAGNEKKETLEESVNNQRSEYNNNVDELPENTFPVSEKIKLFPYHLSGKDGL